MRKINLEKMAKISNVDIWLKVAPPKGGEAQWKDGRSAKELARFVIEHPEDFSNLLEEVVKSSVGYVPSSFTGEPEAVTRLPHSSSGPRNHDLLLFDKRIVIGIEAKVDEPFGNSILQESNTSSTDKKDRIDWLIETILPEGRGLDDREVGNLKYQLFTATAGTLLEAAKRGKKKCIFLILVFHSKNKPVKETNKKSFDDFVRIVCGENKNSKEFQVNDNPITCWFIEKDIEITPQAYKID